MPRSSLFSLLAALMLAFGLAGTAGAQTTAGNIGGEARAGETVVINGPATGFHRELTIGEA